MEPCLNRAWGFVVVEIKASTLVLGRRDSKAPNPNCWCWSQRVFLGGAHLIIDLQGLEAYHLNYGWEHNPASWAALQTLWNSGFWTSPLCTDRGCLATDISRYRYRCPDLRYLLGSLVLVLITCLRKNLSCSLTLCL